jgi:AAA+ ATPase superfamily predicted ATPase
MQIIGRKQEQQELARLFNSSKPEFLAVYGRRRVGKTYLIREFFDNDFAFHMTGSRKMDTNQLLRVFDVAMNRHFGDGFVPAKDWLEAFESLRNQLEQLAGKQQSYDKADTQTQPRTTGKLVIFIDELPWFDRGKSGFLAALEHFWNDWASSRPDVLLIVCGSATSWIAKKLFHDKGGLHNRITARIALEPFSLKECEDYFSYLGIVLSRYQILESYMVFGGIPFYLGMFDKKYPITQNVDRLFFGKSAALRDEYDELFSSLFQNPARHTAIVEALTSRQFGLTREEILRKTRLAAGGSLSNTLLELEQCGFITRFSDFTRPKKVIYYKLTDPFVLFFLKYVKDNDTHDEFFWSNYSRDAGYRAWSGLAFEQVCALHILQLRRALGISGVSTQVSSWRSSITEPGAQIDLLIDRKDGVINICEMKYTTQPLTIDAKMDADLLHKMQVFAAETGTRKAIHMTIVTTYGLSEHGYHGSVQAQITMEDLFV